MRILQVLEHLDVGGLERLALDLALAQKAAGHEPAFYCLLNRGRLADEAASGGIPVTAFNKRPGLSPALLLKMAARMRRERYDIVHAHNPGVHHYAAAAARLAGARAVINTRHGPLNSENRGYGERYFRAALPLTDKVVFVSDHARRFALERGFVTPEKSCVILNGIHVEKFRPAAPGAVRPRIRFGTVGRMAPVKAQSVLVDAFAIVRRRAPEAELRITGDGPLFADIKSQIERLGLTAAVHLDGLNTDTPSILSQLDVFVLSSHSEGLPIVILEAMAAGLPIVSTRVGGIPEAAPEREIAWYCPPGNPQALAEAMLQAAGSPALAEMGRRAAQIAAQRFNLAVMYRQYEALFTACVSRS